MIGFSLSHKVEDDEIEGLFDTSSDEEQQVKRRAKVAFKDETEIVEPEKGEYKYFDETPEFKSASEKYIYYGLKYKLEFLLVAITLMFVFNFFLGKKVNSNLAVAFHQRCIEPLQKNFAHLGLGDISNTSLNQILFNEFEFYASGRDNCKYILINYVMKKRQDMFSNQILGLIWPTEDQVFLEIGIESEAPVEAIICKLINAKSTLNDMPHLKKFVKVIKNVPLESAGFALYAEGEDNARAVFNDSFIEQIVKYASSIHVLHITD